MKILRIVFLCLFFSVLAFAKDVPKQVINWPSDENPLLRFSVMKIKEMGSYNTQRTYSIEVTIDNLTKKKISRASFSMYIADKKNVRIGDGYLSFEDVGPNESLKITVNAVTSGAPETISLVAKGLPSELGALAPVKKVSITVYSVPSGATLKVDGFDAGVTPLAISVPVGSHMLKFAKEGFSEGSFPLVIAPDQLSGGSVSYELGQSAHDSIEMRDGTVITGDVESVSATEVVIRIAGNPQSFNRNMVKRIGFTVRQQ
jgi:hypothetical protein